MKQTCVCWTRFASCQTTCRFSEIFWLITNTYKSKSGKSTNVTSTFTQLNHINVGANTSTISSMINHLSYDISDVCFFICSFGWCYYILGATFATTFAGNYTFVISFREYVLKPNVNKYASVCEWLNNCYFGTLFLYFWLGNVIFDKQTHWMFGIFPNCVT